jgi:hypothetical protein
MMMMMSLTNAGICVCVADLGELQDLNSNGITGDVVMVGVSY